MTCTKWCSFLLFSIMYTQLRNHHKNTRQRQRQQYKWCGQFHKLLALHSSPYYVLSHDYVYCTTVWFRSKAVYTWQISDYPSLFYLKQHSCRYALYLVFCTTEAVIAVHYNYTFFFPSLAASHCIKKKTNHPKSRLKTKIKNMSIKSAAKNPNNIG